MKFELEEARRVHELQDLALVPVRRSLGGSSASYSWFIDERVGRAHPKKWLSTTLCHSRKEASARKMRIRVQNYQVEDGKDKREMRNERI